MAPNVRRMSLRTGYYILVTLDCGELTELTEHNI